jgi:cytochrome c biogenesis protein
VEMAGLGRSESAKVPEELGDLAGVLYDLAPGAPDPDVAPDAQHPAKTPVADPAPEPSTEPTTPDTQVVPAERPEK